MNVIQYTGCIYHLPQVAVVRLDVRNQELRRLRTHCVLPHVNVSHQEAEGERDVSTFQQATTMSAASASAPVLRTMQATDESRPNARATVEQFDREFQQYTTKHGGKSARAVAMARAELSKYRALLWQDDKLTAAKAKQGRLTAAQRAAYEKKVADIEKALDQFHHNVANYNRTKAILSFMLLTAFALLAFFQPWKKYF